MLCSVMPPCCTTFFFAGGQLFCGSGLAGVCALGGSEACELLVPDELAFAGVGTQVASGTTFFFCSAFFVVLPFGLLIGAFDGGGDEDGFVVSGDV